MAHASGKTVVGKHKRAVSEDRSGILSETGAEDSIRNSGGSKTPASPRDSPRRRRKGEPRGSPKVGRSILKGGTDSNKFTDDADTMITTVEIRKRPGQSLGFYIREGNASTRTDGVFISRIAPGSVVENNGLLRVGDEILSVNSVDVRAMSIDDVVILMSIPKRLVLSIRTHKPGARNGSCPSLSSLEPEEQPPVVVLKKNRSSSISTMEMTEQCHDEFVSPSGDYQSFYKNNPKLLQKLDDLPGRKMQGPPLGLLRIASPVDKQFMDDSGDSGLSSENSAYSQSSQAQAPFSVPASDCDKVKFSTDMQKYVNIPSPLTVSDKHIDNLLHQKSGPVVTVTSPRTGRRTFPLEKNSAHLAEMKAGLHTSKSVSEGFMHKYGPTHPSPLSMPPGSGTLYHDNAKPWLRCMSPEAYISDSEVAYSPSHQVKREGEGSYITPLSDSSDQHVQRKDHGPADEIQQWLQKFDTQLSNQLQERTQNQNKWPPGQDGIKKVGSPHGTSPLSILHVKHLSPSMPRRTTSPQKPPVSQRRVTRKHSADSLLDYRTYQLEDEDFTSQTVSQPSQSPTSSLVSLSRSSSGTRLRQNNDTQGTPASRLRDLQLARKPVQVNINNFRPYQSAVDYSQIISSTPIDGLLSVHIYCGHGLKSSKTVLRDLYCVIEVDGINQARTMIRTGAINFDWDEAFDLELDSVSNVSFQVHNWDPNVRHRLCFTGTVNLSNLLNTGVSHKIALNLEPKGILYLELDYKEPAVSLQRVPSMRKNALFGVSLETVVKREKSSVGVPVVVQRCVEEVERRGLHHVGIYRVCGSAKRKARLKAELEQNPWTTELTTDAVTDINVITGVLKDYLRELPEPLFTDALYQMLLDSFSVRLPEDPEGNAQLIFGVLECLPKANQDSLSYILDHLKKVLRKSDMNRMSAHNLSVCFGPVLLCPSPKNNRSLNLGRDIKKQIEVLSYLLDIWPTNRGASKHGACLSWERSSSIKSDSSSSTQKDSASSTSNSAKRLTYQTQSSDVTDGYLGNQRDYRYSNFGVSIPGSYGIYENVPPASNNYNELPVPQRSSRQAQQHFQRMRSHSTECETRNKLYEPPPPPLYPKVIQKPKVHYATPERIQGNVPVHKNISVDTSKPNPQQFSTYQSNYYCQGSKQYSAYRKMMKQQRAASGYESS